MIDRSPRIARGRTETRTKLVGISGEAAAYTGSRPLSNHACPGWIVRGGSSPTLSSSPPAIRQRIPPPLCRCGSDCSHASAASTCGRVPRAVRSPAWIKRSAAGTFSFAW